MWHDGSQNNEISCSSWSASKSLAEDQDQAELFTDILLSKQVKTIQKLVHSVHESAPFYLTHA